MSKVTIKILVVSLVCLLVSSSVFGFMFYHVVGQSGKLSEQIEALGKQRAQEESYLKSQRIAKETEQDREKIEKYFLLNESDSIGFLTNIESLAPKKGLVLKTNNLDTLEADGKKWVKISFTFSGARNNVEDFINILESVPYVSRITNVDMGLVSGFEWKADVTMQVQILSI